MIVKAEIIRQSDDTFSLSLRYGKRKEAKELINLFESEYEEPCKLARSIPMISNTKSISCPKGIYLFDLDTRNQVYDLKAGKHVALMGVNETSGKDILKVLDAIYEALSSNQKGKLIVRVDKNQRPRIYSKCSRSFFERFLGVS